MADRKKPISKQERQVRQRAARQAKMERRQRTWYRYVAIGVVAILFVFGVLGQNLRGKGSSKEQTPPTVVGQVSCPKEDGTSDRQTYFNRAPGRCIDATKIYDAIVHTTAGVITAELYPGRAFNAVNNFVFLARYHFYDGLPFHRVLKDTYAQTGDPTAPGITGPGYQFPDDGLPTTSSEYVIGALLYAHEAHDENGSQVLFITGPQGVTLNPTFPLFGQVKKGFPVLAKINAGASDNTNTPAIRYSVQTIEIRVHKS